VLRKSMNLLEREGFYEPTVYIGYEYICNKSYCLSPYCHGHSHDDVNNSFANRIARYKQYYNEKRLRVACPSMENCTINMCLKDHPDNSTPYIRYLRFMANVCHDGVRCVSLDCTRVHRFEETGEDTSLFERIGILQIYINEHLFYVRGTNSVKKCDFDTKCNYVRCYRYHSDNSDVLIRLIRKEGFANVMRRMPPP